MFMFTVLNILLFWAAIIHNMFENSSNFHMKQRTTGKVKFLFVRSLLLVVTKFSFLEKNWVLGNNSGKFWDFTDLFYFPNTLSIRLFDNSWSNSYIKPYLTGGERKTCSTTKKSQIIMNMIVFNFVCFFVFAFHVFINRSNC